jgi:hypothetical protein
LRKFFGLIMVLGLSSALWAQGEQPDCGESRTFEDKGCSNDPNCPPDSWTSCTSYHFTAGCTGNYNVDCWTTCPDHDCNHCRVCFAISDPTFLTICTTNNCQNNCTSTDPFTVYLISGQTYTVRVCLSICQDQADCSYCPGSECYAYGCLRIGQTAPCY